MEGGDARRGAHDVDEPFSSNNAANDPNCSATIMPGRFRALGVDGVFTDHPDVAVTALAHPAQL
jgi:glycerophosphoryl diester phosphodiesterase